MSITEFTTHPYVLEKNYIIRTVTHYYIGKLVAVYDKELVLTGASWVADTGRWGKCLETGSLNEVEIFPKELEVIVSRLGIIDACAWEHELPVRTYPE